LIEISCDHCAIRHRALCGSLSRDELTELNKVARFRDVAAGGSIQRSAEHVQYFANVVSGVVKLTKSLSDGRQQIVGLQFSSNFLGRPYGQASTYDAEAATDVRLCTFPRPQFERLVREFPGLEHRLFENALTELDAARDWMLLLGRKSASEKVASFLMLVAENSRQVGCGGSDAETSAKFDLPLTRTEIADYLGLTIETVSRQLSRLRAQGAIRLDGPRTVIVPNLGRLAEAAEQQGEKLR
jgi:CRP/FNR family transcriptional regulator